MRLYLFAISAYATIAISRRRSLGLNADTHADLIPYRVKVEPVAKEAAPP